MVEGIAHLLGLRPPPDEWAKVAWAKTIGKSPSEMSTEDMQWAAIAGDMDWAIRIFTVLHKGGARAVKTLDPDDWAALVELENEAKRTYQ